MCFQNNNNNNVKFKLHTLVHLNFAENFDLKGKKKNFMLRKIHVCSSVT
jgi:hypothetical protein